VCRRTPAHTSAAPGSMNRQQVVGKAQAGWQLAAQGNRVHAVRILRHARLRQQKPGRSRRWPVPAQARLERCFHSPRR
jgi:hypothetical protein